MKAPAVALGRVRAVSLVQTWRPIAPQPRTIICTGCGQTLDLVGSPFGVVAYAHRTTPYCKGRNE